MCRPLTYAITDFEIDVRPFVCLRSLLYLKIIIILLIFLERQREGEGERERRVEHLSAGWCTPSTGDQTYNLCMCRQGIEAARSLCMEDAQPTEPQWSGFSDLFLYTPVSHLHCAESITLLAYHPGWTVRF